MENQEQNKTATRPATQTSNDDRPHPLDTFGGTAGAQARARRHTTAIVGVMAVALLARLAGLLTSPPTSQVGRANPARIDPSTDAWFDLAILPGLGPGRAMAIVEYRQRHAGSQPGGSGSVFKHPADLARVPGIGPITVERLGPFLASPNPPTTPDSQ